MPQHILSICAHHQEVKIALHSLWYHHTYRWPSRAHVLSLAVYSIVLRTIKYHDISHSKPNSDNTNLKAYTQVFVQYNATASIYMKANILCQIIT